MKIKNILKYVAVSLGSFVTISLVFSYPNFNLEQLSPQQIQYSTLGAMGTTIVFMFYNIRKLFQKIKREKNLKKRI